MSTMTLEDLKRLDTRNPGGWPTPVKGGVLGLLLLSIVFGGYFYDWSGLLETLESRKKEEERLKQSFLEKKKEAVNLDIYRQQLAEIEQTFGALLRQLPNKAEMDALVTDINQAGLGRGCSSSCSSRRRGRRCSISMPSFPSKCVSPAATMTWGHSQAMSPSFPGSSPWTASPSRKPRTAW